MERFYTFDRLSKVDILERYQKRLILLLLVLIYFNIIYIYIGNSKPLCEGTRPEKYYHHTLFFRKAALLCS